MYVEETAEAIGQMGGIREAGDAIARLIYGTSSYAEVARICEMHLNTSEPAYRIQTILMIAEGSSVKSPPIPRKLSKRCRLWTRDDDVRLLAGLRRYGIGDWKQIAIFVGNGKTSSQCSQRWSRALNPSLSKEQWTEDEDRELLESVAEYGEHSWARVSKQMGSRSDVQCRYRFEQLQKAKQTAETQKTVLRLVKDPFELPFSELMPPLILREPQGIRFVKGI
jgi:hypothetical protein